jgi:hypothetical protein
MKLFLAIFFALSMMVSLVFVGGESMSARAMSSQTVKQKTVSYSRKGYHKSKRVSKKGWYKTKRTSKHGWHKTRHVFHKTKKKIW